MFVVVAVDLVSSVGVIAVVASVADNNASILIVRLRPSSSQLLPGCVLVIILIDNVVLIHVFVLVGVKFAQSKTKNEWSKMATML